MEAFNYREELKIIPNKPGVYQYFDKNDVLIYVGKAKKLKNRVSSYFVDESQLNAKTRVLVRKIQRIAFTIVDTEIDAWLLENNLIKKHKPRYNVMLKDDKTYPWIVIKNERFPRVFWTRKYVKDGSKYYGPYASLGMMHVVLDTIRELFPLRTCSLNLSEENIAKGKFKTCLEYQIGNCKGVCEGLQTEADYNLNIESVKDILNGKISLVTNTIKDQLKSAIDNLNFEEAHILKIKLDKLANYQSKSTVVSSSITNVDVFSIASDDTYAFVNFLKVMNGVVIQTQTLEIKKRLDESDEELLALALIKIRSRFKSSSSEIIVPFEIKEDLLPEGVKIHVPKLGDKRKLVDLSMKNVAYFKKERLLHYERLNPEKKYERLLFQMQKDLRLNVLPRHIECFDNSNIQGSFPVSAVVVFKNAKPSKKEYRHFNVKTVEGPNDFATMEEAVYRRYKRLLKEEQALPQLVVIDGGKGQLSAALKSLKLLGVDKQMTVIGIAERLEEIFYPGDQFPLYLDKKSETLKTIQHLRDEAHRFGLTFHRKQRSRKTFVSELDNIPTLGKVSVAKLLSKFKSVKQIKGLSEEELLSVLTKKQVRALKSYFENEKG